MSNWMTRRSAVVCGAVATVVGSSLLAQERRPSDDGFTFKSSVELVSVNATVTDSSGHFVSRLRAEDFTIFEDGERQTITQFESERVPVSLGIVLDTSGSMAGEKMDAARAALGRFVYDLLQPGDEMFLYRFDSRPILVQGWTEDRARLVRGLGSVRPAGGTALYDAVADAVPLAGEGSRRKKALVVISDGNDTNSELDVDELQPLIRESEVMVYAIGIDGSGSSGVTRRTPGIQLPGGISLPWPSPSRPSQRPSPRSRGGAEAGVNERALRMITDDSGGRTEIIAGARNLDQATAGIASELSQQYFLGYVSTRPKDGRWHTIKVQLKNSNHQVRARRGFVAG
jgi:Ca-activated chloride channel family protein